MRSGPGCGVAKLRRVRGRARLVCCWGASNERGPPWILRDGVGRIDGSCGVPVVEAADARLDRADLPGGVPARPGGLQPVELGGQDVAGLRPCLGPGDALPLAGLGGEAVLCALVDGLGLVAQ